MLRTSLMALTVAAAVILVAPAQAKFAGLIGEVGPGFSIEVKNAAGKDLQTIKAGTYRIKVEDKSAIHNFHLFGPGLNKKTGIASKGDTIWTITLKPGRYTYQCDPHAARGMKGHFTVTGQAKFAGLAGEVGPGFTVEVKNAAGKDLQTIKAGPYRMKVEDKASIHNFHLFGPGLDKRTGVSFKGDVIWTIKLKPGRYTYQCDPHHLRGMRGHFTVTA
jgi:plastocyanin